MTGKMCKSRRDLQMDVGKLVEFSTGMAFFQSGVKKIVENLAIT